MHVAALLLHDDGNAYDANAVAVYIDGKLVGHLSSETAVRFRLQMSELGYAGYPAAARAYISGGWNDDHGDCGFFGVKLGFDDPLTVDQEQLVLLLTDEPHAVNADNIS